MTLTQLVPSEYCLQCRGCCVFREPQSAWCARLTVEEEIALEIRLPQCSFGGKLRDVPLPDGRHGCRCLNVEDHHCRVYDARPFECALYPFLLSAEDGRLKLYAHQACPFVREQSGSPQWGRYVVGLKAFLQAPAQAGLLKAAGAVVPDYGRFGDEVVFIAELPITGAGPGLWQRQGELEGWFRRRRSPLSSRSFINVLAWSDAFDFTFEEVDGNMLVFARQNGAEFLFCPPLGEHISPRAVAHAFARMKGGAARIEAVAGNELAAFDDAQVRAHVQGEEYYYERARIASLTGNDYRSKRSDVNICRSRYRPVFRPFVAEDAQACADLFDRWLDNRRASYEDGIYRAMLVENRLVHRRMIGGASRLGLVGRVVEVAGQLAGYTFGYPLNDDTFCVALEVAAAPWKGLPAFLFRELCADAAVAPFKFINAMDDFGMPGVARAKRSWRPVAMEKVYAVCLKP